jgi:hypothetical protein
MTIAEGAFEVRPVAPGVHVITERDIPMPI